MRGGFNLADEGIFKLPQFPTVYEEKDVQRLQQLEEQRKAMALAYGAKFSKEAWAKVPAWEKFGREIAPTWAIPAIRALPGTIETWEYGFTPEQFEGTQEDVEKEYQEISRRKKVTSLLPNIQAGIMLTALKGEPILDTSELLSTFPELRNDFTDEEINYLARLSQIMARATPEDILSGSLFAYDNQLPISKEDIMALFPEGKIDPRFLSSTVAFSKDLEEVTSALQEAYPAEDTGEELSNKTLAEIEEWYKRLLEEQGIIPKSPDKEGITQDHTELSDSIGSLITITDDDGKMFQANRRTDNSLWVGGELWGYYDENTDRVYPYDTSGQPAITEEAREGVSKDWWDALYKSFKEMGLRFQNAFLYTYPASVIDQMKRQLSPEGYELTPSKLFIEFSPYWSLVSANIDKKTKEALTGIMEQQLSDMKQDYNTRMANYQVWLGEHPELQPRPEWQGSAVEKIKADPKTLLDVGYMGYLMADNASTIAAFAATIGVAYGTRNPLLTLGVGSALFAPLETQDLYEDLIASGASEEFALSISPKAGALIASVESLGAMPIARAVSPAFFAAFRKNVASQLVKLTTAQMVKQAGVQAAKIEASEVAEEILQEVLHNAFVKTVDENRELLENVPEVTVRAMISIVPLAGFGGAMHFREMRSHLPKEAQESLDADIKIATDAGASEEDAKMGALVNLAQTETGQQQILDAVEKAGINIYEEREAVVPPEDEPSRIISKWQDPNRKKNALLLRKDLEKLEAKGVDVEAVYEKLVEYNTTERADFDSAEEYQEARDDAWGEVIDELDNLEEVEPVPPTATTPTPASRAIIDTEKRIASYNAEIKTIEDSLKIQRDRLQKMIGAKELPGSRMEQHGIISRLEETLEDLQKDKALAQKKLGKTREEVKVVAPMVGIVTPINTPQEAIDTGKFLVRGDTPTFKREAWDKAGGTWFTNDIESASKGYGKDLSFAERPENPAMFKDWDEVWKKYPTAPGVLEDDIFIDLRKKLEAEGYDSVDFIKEVWIFGKPRLFKLGELKEAVAPTEAAVVTREMPASWMEFNQYAVEKPEYLEFHRFMELYSHLAIDGKAFPDGSVDELFTLISEHKPTFQNEAFEGAFSEAERTGERIEKVIAIDIYAQLLHSSVTLMLPSFGLKLSQEEATRIFDLTRQVLDDLAEGRLKEFTYTTKTVERIVPKPVEAVSLETPQQEAVDSTTADTQHILASPWLQADPLLPDRRPRVMDWDKEQAGVGETLEDTKIANAVKLPPIIRQTRELLTHTINRLQDGYEEAKRSKDKDAIQEVETTLKDMARIAGLSSKGLLGKRWGDLSYEDRLRLTASAIPDKTIKFSGLKEVMDMEYFMQFLEEMTGAPFYSMLVRVEKANSAAETAKELVLQRISTDPHFRGVRTDKGALVRVAQEINARNKLQNVEHPLDISPEEMLLADAIEDIYSYYKPIVRYLRVMRTQPTMEEFKKEFPDAVEAGMEAELENTIDIVEKGTLDDVWNYLYNKTWGVIESGFDPRLITSPGLKVGRRGGLKVTRGKGRLIRRESIEYPAGKMHQDVLARLASYVEQMEIQWRIEPEIDKVAEWWELVGDKFENWSQIEQGLETWLERVQNIGLGYNWADRMVRRLWRQAMVSVFLEPYMAFRNSFQALVFHPDRTELARYLIDRGKLPVDLKEQFKLFFDTNISQLGGLRRDWLHVGERGFLVPEWFNRLADSVCLYGKSDYHPRYWSSLAALNKAHRATEQYLKDGDINKWIKNSGANHLRQTERNYVISHYLGQATKKFDEGIAGLRELSGARMAEFYIARRIADITHFKYRRSTRGLIEMGKTGSTLWNLIVFPRGYGQRLYFQAEKIKKAFSGEATWEEARTGFMDIMKLVTVSMLFGQLFTVLTGRRRNPYDPLNIVFGWQFGGLFVGIAQDVSILIGNLATIINPNAAQEDKDFAVNAMPGSLTRLPETLIPFVRRGVDIAETILSKKNIIAYGVRKVIGMYDKDYTPEELDDMDRNLWEQIRKAVLGGEIQDPTKLDNSLKKLDDAQTKLGTMGITGRYYTLGDFGSEVSSITRDVPSVFLTEQEGLTPLALFYLDCETQWDELFTLPSSKRDDWRKEHPTEEAMLLFWEKYQRPVYQAREPEAAEVIDLLIMWFDQYEIDKSMHGFWTTWELPVEIPTEE